MIHRLAIPTPFMVGRVNCYLIEDEPLTLVDTGPNSGKALDELSLALAAHGRRIEDLERIVVTHQHPDHAGLVAILARRSGAEVCGLDLLAPFLADWADACERDDELAEALMRRHGIPVEVVLVLRAMARGFRAWGSAAEVTAPLHDGGTLEFAGRSLRVHHRPGHSPSDTVFHDVEGRVLIGGDHLLGRISSVPLIQGALGGKSGDPADGRPHTLVMYLRSLRETAAMEDVDVVLPGHGDDILDARDLIDRRIAMHERRAGKILGLIASRPRSAYEVAREMWGDVAITQAYLTLCEVLGHVDLLMDRGQVVEEEAEGVVRFAVV